MESLERPTEHMDLEWKLQSYKADDEELKWLESKYQNKKTKKQKEVKYLSMFVLPEPLKSVWWSDVQWSGIYPPDKYTDKVS